MARSLMVTGGAGFIGVNFVVDEVHADESCSARDHH